jgi:hypothetical protein
MGVLCRKGGRLYRLARAMNCFGLLSSSYSKQMREFAVQLGAVATQYDDCIASADSARKVERFLSEGKTLGYAGRVQYTYRFCEREKDSRCCFYRYPARAYT